MMTMDAAVHEKKVWVSGATGILGREVLKQLSQRGFKNGLAFFT